MPVSPKNAPNTGQPIGIDALPAELTLIPSAPARPPASTRPSWIGPKPAAPQPTADTAMEYSVTIEFSSPGLKPPVYICTSLSEPAWEPVEMHFDGMEHGEYLFYSVFSAKEGEYQYKLRLGPGDWWACDESKPTVDDGAGNKNNVVTVRAADYQPDEDYIDEDRNSKTYGRRISAVHGVPLFEHEAFSGPNMQPFDEVIDDSEPGSKESHELAPLLPHERLSPSNTKQSDGESSRWSTAPVSPRASMSARRNSGRTMTIDESDLDDPRLQPCLENKDAILDLAQRMSSGLAPCLEAPHPAVVTKLINRAYDVMQLPDNRPTQRRASTTEEVMAALGLGEVANDDADHKLAIITEADEDTSLNDRTTGKQATLFRHTSDPFSASVTAGEEASKAREEDPDNLTQRSVKFEGTDGVTEVEERSQAIDSHPNNPSAVFLGLGFVFAVAATAIGIWTTRSRT